METRFPNGTAAMPHKNKDFSTHSKLEMDWEYSRVAERLPRTISRHACKIPFEVDGDLDQAVYPIASLFQGDT